jgi:HAMP domain-containing protein
VIRHLPPFAAWRLSTRMVALSLAMLLALQAAGLLALRASIERNARSELSQRLQVGERIWTRLLEQRAAKLSQAATLLAADYGFRSALTSDDGATIESALDNHGARIGATVSALLDTRLAVRHLAHGEGPAPQPALAMLGRVAPRLAERGSTVALVGDRPYQFVMVPVRAPLVIGWVAMGFEIDRMLVDDLHAVSGIHGSLLARAPEGHEQLLFGLRPDDADTGPQITRRVPVAADGGSVVLVLAGSVDEAAAPYRALQWTMAAITLLGLVLFGIGSAWTARRVTRPLRGLVRASHRLGRGEYDTPIEHGSAHDEVGELARAFDHMRGNIAVQQQEIRQLAYWDRLTALPNRAQFRDAVIAAIAAGDPSRGALSVVMLDLDRFKHVNDVLGYASGDRLLQSVAARLADRGARRRHGGAPGRRRVRAAAARRRRGGGAGGGRAHRQGVRGAADAARPHGGPVGRAGHRLLAGARRRRRHAAVARRGGDVRRQAPHRRRVLYDSALDNASARDAVAADRAAPGGRRGPAAPVPAAQGALDSGALCGAEALVRWQHPVRGLVPPMQFIPFAEQTGFIRQLTLWMFEEVARRQAALAALGVPGVDQPVHARPAGRGAAAEAGRASWRATARARAASAWRSPRARSWTTRSAPRPRCSACPSAATSCRSTTSAPATRRWPT